MPTLQELLENDYASGSVKTASHREEDLDGIDKLAAQLGLFSDFEKSASDDEEDKDDKDDKEDEDEGEEKQSSYNVDGLYNSIFPEDNLFNKVASHDKVAAYEEALGGAAFEHFSGRFNARIEKIASEMLSGEAHDPTPPQAFENNAPGNFGQNIDSTPSIDNELPADNGDEVVGHEEQKKVAMDLALRKAMILSQLED